MAKNKKKADVINYVSKGIIEIDVTAAQSLDDANVSRRPGLDGMTNPRFNEKGEFQGLNQNFLSVVSSLVSDGYNEAKGPMMVVSAPFKGEQAKLKKARKELIPALEKFELSKSGHLNFDGPNEKPDRLDKETLVKWAKENYSDVTPEWIPVQGNCRLLAILMANPVRVAQGKEPITKVRVEVRDYATVNDRDKDCVFLNETHDDGKQKTSRTEKIRGAFHLSKKGIRQRDLDKVFVKRGMVQFLWSLITTIRYLAWWKKDKADKFRDAMCDGTLEISQNHQKDLHERRVACEHRDFSTSYNKATFIGSGKVADAMSVKKHVLANPEKTVAPIADYYAGIMDGSLEPQGRVKALPRTQIVNLAADLEEGPRQDLLVSIANADADGAVKALEALGDVIRCRTADGELTGKALSQSDFDLIMGGLGVAGYPQPATA